MPSETFTLSGAKKALANLQRIYPEGGFYSIERLSCYYIDFGEQRIITDPKQKIYDKISHAMNRLDELWDGNEFDNGDKMRINEVRAVLKRIKEKLLRQQ